MNTQPVVIPVSIRLEGRWARIGELVLGDNDSLVFHSDPIEPLMTRDEQLDETYDTPEIEDRLDAFESELSGLINKYSLENLSGTPDFILAKHMVRSLVVLNKTTQHRAQWRGQPLNLFDETPATSAQD